MPKRISKPKRPSDPNLLAAEIVRISTSENEEKGLDKETISKIMAEMGRKGGRIGGKKRLEMAPEKRSKLAYEAAKARWAKRKKAKAPTQNC